MDAREHVIRWKEDLQPSGITGLQPSFDLRSIDVAVQPKRRKDFCLQLALYVILNRTKSQEPEVRSLRRFGVHARGQDAACYRRIHSTICHFAEDIGVRASKPLALLWAPLLAGGRVYSVPLDQVWPVTVDGFEHIDVGKNCCAVRKDADGIKRVASDKAEEDRTSSPHKRRIASMRADAKVEVVYAPLTKQAILVV